MRYVLNSAVITSPGRYAYRLVTAEEGRTWLATGPWESSIGYAETCAAFGVLFGETPPLNRRQFIMHAGDEALIFRLTVRMSDPALKGNLGPDFVLKNCEIGILRKEMEEGGEE